MQLVSNVRPVSKGAALSNYDYHLWYIYIQEGTTLTSRVWALC